MNREQAIPQGFTLEEPVPAGFQLEERRKGPTKEQNDAQRAADRELYSPTKGTSWGQRALENVGAGMDSAWQGVKQLTGNGPSDEEIHEKRRFDERLADDTAFGGALQVAGEVAPTIPLGFGAAAGMTKLGGIAARMAASPTLSAMGGGALGGALQPVTSDESRVQNMGVGALGGAVAPQVLKLAMKGGRGATQLGQRVVSALPGALGERAAEAVGGRKTAGILKRELGGGQPLNDVYTPHPHLDGPGPTAAMATQDPRLASLERGSRTTGGEHWMPYDQAASEARWKMLDEGLLNEGDLARHLGEANKIGAEAPDVYKAVGSKRFNSAMDDFYEKLQTAKQTPQYHGNPQVKAAVDYVEGTMKQAGQVTPELLHTMRRTLAGGLTGVPGVGDAATRAASKEPFVLGITKEMDQILDATSKGKFGDWKGRYAEKMTKADSAKADINIRSKFVDPATGMPLKPTTGLDGVPDLQPHALRQAVKTAGSATRGPKKGQNLLQTGSQDVLEGVARDLEAKGVIARSKAASTGGSGSDTASNLTQAAILEGLLPTGLGTARYVVAEGGRKADKAMQRQLAELLQDPAKLRAFIRAQEQQRLLRGTAPNLPGVGAGAGAALMLGGAEE